MIEGSTTAFYKGVIEWLLSKKAYMREVEKGTDIVKVSYAEVLADVDSVSQRIHEFTNGDYSIDIGQASSTISKPNDYT